MSDSVFRSVGQIGKLFVAKEEEYGTPGKIFFYMGNLLNATAMNDVNYEALPPTCSRTRSDAYKTRRKYGLSLTTKYTDEGDLMDVFVHMMEGKAFTAFARMAYDEYHGYTGSVLDELTITCPKIGSAIEFDMTITSQYLSISETRDAWNALNVHFNAPEMSCDNGKVLTGRGDALMTINGSQEKVPFDNWNITVKNNSEPVNGYVGDFALEAGAGNVLGMMEIEATIVQASKSNMWNLRKWLCEEPEELIFPLIAGNDKYSLVLKDMYFVGNTMAEHQAESLYNENIQVNAKSIELIKN